MFFQNISAAHAKNLAIYDSHGELHFGDLEILSNGLAAHLLENLGPLKDKCITFLCQPERNFVLAQWGIWKAGGISVPLSPLHPVAELKYYISQTQSKALICDDQNQKTAESLSKELNIPVLPIKTLARPKDKPLPQINLGDRANILFTSGTTGKPKGVVTTHSQLQSQIQSLLQAWQWSSTDHILNVLPLHHTHGLINVVSCALASRATVHMHSSFKAENVWKAFIEKPLSVFMAVPTIYAKLIQYWENASSSEQTKMQAACKKFRLMVSGSAALPLKVFDQWKSISNHTLLERYGMTEIGMALSNPYVGERRRGFVGQPLPGVEIRLFDEKKADVTAAGSGELGVKGPGVFTEYWSNPSATREAFYEGWFLTGDMVEKESGYFRILGRKSSDILKSGGYKISALEIENKLRDHAAVEDVAVVGMPDPMLEQKLVAFVVLRPDCLCNDGDLKAWGKTQMADYKVPRQHVFLSVLPKNVMGKVDKKALLATLKPNQ